MERNTKSGDIQARTKNGPLPDSEIIEDDNVRGFPKGKNGNSAKTVEDLNRNQNMPDDGYERSDAGFASNKKTPPREAMENDSYDASATAEMASELNAVGDLNSKDKAEEESRGVQIGVVEQMIDGTKAAIIDQAIKLAEVSQFKERDWKLLIRSKIVLSFLICLALQIAAAMNAARFVVDETQSYMLALFFVGIIPAVAVGLEAYAHRLATRRSILECILGYVFVFSFLVFLWQFANEFALVPGIEQFAEALGGFDYRVLLISQTLVEITVTFGLASKVRTWIELLPEPRINPIWRKRSEEMERLDNALHAYLERLNELLLASAEFRDRNERIKARQRKLKKFLQS